MSESKDGTVSTKLVKHKIGGLGFLVKERQTKPCVAISGIVKGSTAEANGMLRVGDVLLEVNGKSLQETTFVKAIEILNDIPVGNVAALKLRAKDGTKAKIQTTFSETGSANTCRVQQEIQLTQPEANGTSSPALKHKESAKKQPDGQSIIPDASNIKSTNGYPDKIIENDASSPMPSALHKCPFTGGIREESKTPKIIKLKNWETGKEYIDTLHQKAKTPLNCTAARCEGSFMRPYGGEVPSSRPYGIPRPKEEVADHAEDFIEQYYSSMKMADSPTHKKRIAEVLKEIEETGTYDLTEKELMFGARMAWRNAPRCIGRIQWNRLHLFDARDVFTNRGMFDAIVKHIKYGTNKGNLRSTITVFPQRKEPNQDFRVWNGQLITYAGYRQPDGSIIGDPANAELTDICISLGWEPKGGQFDVLPLVLQAGGEEPEMFELPPELVLQVKLKHPKYPWFEEMGLQWYALPAVSCLCLDVGGIEFPACPFNGWYMVTEIGARDLGDPSRYNLLEPVAKKMGLDTKKNASLWKDLACIELNLAVLHSFQDAGVTITDHHSVAETFMKHFENETKLRGGCPGDWVWIVPPVSGSSTPVFHQEMLNYTLKPSYEYQDDPWKHYRIKRKESDSPKKKITFKEVAKAVKFSAKLMGKAMAKRTKAIILYATETGKSESYAKMLSDMFLHAFDPKVMCMDEYPHPELENEQLVLIVTSTFGNGDPPENGESFARYLYELRHPTNEQTSRDKMAVISSLLMQKEKERGLKMKDDEQPLASLRYSVFGLGSRAYPNFCAFAKSVDKIIQELGGEQVYKMGEGDELCGQEEAFKTWAKKVFKAACETFCIGEEVNLAEADASLNTISSGWSPDKYRFTKDNGKVMDPCSNLSVSHNKTIIPTKIISIKNLQSVDSSRATLLVRLDTSDHKDFKYKPGDHLSLFPANKETLVQSLLDRLCEAPDPDQPIVVEASHEVSGPFGSTKKWGKLARFPVPITMREAFTRHIDITGTPAPQILNYLSTQATDPEEKRELEELGKGDSSYENWKYDKQSNIVEVLQEFPSLKVNAALLLTQLPLLQPRFYSISSSQDLYPGEVHATVAVVEFTKRGGRGPIHHGVCSTWLKSLVPNDIVPCFVRHAPSFHLPDDESLPIIMVGPGTGIAPFRSFWQQRQFDRANKPTPQGSWGDMHLYFGCRSSKQDDIYREETAEAINDKSLTKVRTALSREENQPKCYVQDLLKEDAFDIVETLISRHGHFYTCGDVSMAADVCRTLQTMLESYAAMSQQESQDFIDKLKSSGRYHEDIFGVTLRTREVTDRVRTAARKAWAYIATAKSVKKVSSSTIRGRDSQDSSGKIKGSFASPKRYPLDRGPTVTVLMRSEDEVKEEDENLSIAMEARNRRRSSLPDA